MGLANIPYERLGYVITVIKNTPCGFMTVRYVRKIVQGTVQYPWVLYECTRRAFPRVLYECSRRAFINLTPSFSDTLIFDAI